MTVSARNTHLFGQILDFFRKLCIASSRYAEKYNYPETATKEMLRARVQELEEELQQIKEEKDEFISLCENQPVSCETVNNLVDLILV